MSYNKTKVQIYNVKDWYNKVHKIYKTYHKDLDNWDNWAFLKYIPRDISWHTILDIWSWDWRLFRFFKWKPWIKYIAYDISEKLLKKLPLSVTKIVWDLEQDFALKNEEVDIILCFFVLLHIINIDHLFFECNRVLKSWWRFIVLHHIENRPFEYNIDWERFKIDSYKHRYELIEKAAADNFFDMDYMDLKVWNTLVAKLYCFTKK